MVVNWGNVYEEASSCVEGLKFLLALKGDETSSFYTP